MNQVESFITAHIGDRINECDDNFSIDLEKCRFAVADGSSSDFFSNLYARILTDAFIIEGNEMFVEKRINELNSKWRRLVQSKLDEAGCKPGSFPYVRFQKMDPGCSTLIGLQLYKENGELRYKCSGLGDSVLFFVPKDEVVPTLQFSSYSNEQYTLDQSIVFGYVPVISRSYSTKWLENIQFVDRKLQPGVFYLMTDGLAEWILRKDNGDISEKFATLSNLHTQNDFLLYIDDIRSKGAHNDDMTLMKIYIDSESLLFDRSMENVYDYRSVIRKIEDEEIAKAQSKVVVDNLKSDSNKDQENESNSLSSSNSIVIASTASGENENNSKVIIETKEGVCGESNDGKGDVETYIEKSDSESKFVQCIEKKKSMRDLCKSLNVNVQRVLVGILLLACMCYMIFQHTAHKHYQEKMVILIDSLTSIHQNDSIVINSLRTTVQQPQ